MPKLARSWVSSGLLLAIALVLSGCGSSKNEFHVTGKATLAGEPIPHGSITFFPADGAGPVGGGTIKDGSFTANVPPGEKLVSITGYKVTGRAPMDPTMPGSPETDVIEDMVPAIYARQESTPLKASVAGETKDLNFDLEKGELSKPVF